MGSLSMLSLEALLLVLCRLKVKDVRRISKALRSAYCNNNQKLVFRAVLEGVLHGKHPPTLISSLLMNVVSGGPHVSELHVR